MYTSYSQVMLIYSMATYKAPIYKKTVYYPAGAIGLAWLYGVSSSLPTPAYAVYLLVKTRHEGLSLWEVCCTHMRIRAKMP